MLFMCKNALEIWSVLQKNVQNKIILILPNRPMDEVQHSHVNQELTEKIKSLKDLIKTTQKESIEDMWLADLDGIEKEF